MGHTRISLFTSLRQTIIAPQSMFCSKHGANIVERGVMSWHPLHFASARGCLATVCLLLPRGAALEDEACLFTKGTRPDLSLYRRELDDHRADTCTRLYLTALFAELQTVMILLEHGANKQVKAQLGLTLMHAASVDFENYTDRFRIPPAQSSKLSGETWDFRTAPMFTPGSDHISPESRVAILQCLIGI